MRDLIRWLLGGALDQWWPLSREAKAVLQEFGVTSPTDLADAPTALFYALRLRCPEQLDTLREIAACYPIDFYA